MVLDMDRRVIASLCGLFAVGLTYILIVNWEYFRFNITIYILILFSVYCCGSMFVAE